MRRAANAPRKWRQPEGSHDLLCTDKILKIFFCFILQKMAFDVNAYKKARRGICYLCGKQTDRLERHHLKYKDLDGEEITIDVCHDCHFKLHYMPWLLDDVAIYKIIRKLLRGKDLMFAKKLYKQNPRYALSIWLRYVKRWHQERLARALANRRRKLGLKVEEGEEEVKIVNKELLNNDNKNIKIKEKEKEVEKLLRRLFS